MSASTREKKLESQKEVNETAAPSDENTQVKDQYDLYLDKLFADEFPKDNDPQLIPTDIPFKADNPVSIIDHFKKLLLELNTKKKSAEYLRKVFSSINDDGLPFLRNYTNYVKNDIQGNPQQVEINKITIMKLILKFVTKNIITTKAIGLECANKVNAFYDLTEILGNSSHEVRKYCAQAIYHLIKKGQVTEDLLGKNPTKWEKSDLAYLFWRCENNTPYSADLITALLRCDRDKQQAAITKEVLNAYILNELFAAKPAPHQNDEKANPHKFPLVKHITAPHARAFALGFFMIAKDINILEQPQFLSVKQIFNQFNKDMIELLLSIFTPQIKTLVTLKMPGKEKSGDAIGICALKSSLLKDLLLHKILPYSLQDYKNGEWNNMVPFVECRFFRSYFREVLIPLAEKELLQQSIASFSKKVLAFIEEAILESPGGWKLNTPLLSANFNKIFLKGLNQFFMHHPGAEISRTAQFVIIKDLIRIVRLEILENKNILNSKTIEEIIKTHAFRQADKLTPKTSPTENSLFSRAQVSGAEQVSGAPQDQKDIPARCMPNGLAH